MKKFVKIISVSVVMIIALCSVTCLAAVYGTSFPSYISDIFGFNGSAGYDILNVSNSTVNGRIYFKNATGFYGSPSSLDCRFQSFGTLEISVPYQTNYGTRYEWQQLSVTEIKNTNINFADSFADRQNNAFIYSLAEKQNIIIICLLIGLILYFILGRAWNA